MDDDEHIHAYGMGRDVVCSMPQAFFEPISLRCTTNGHLVICVRLVLLEDGERVCVAVEQGSGSA
eukprot:9210357-Karenia_brevis.AAC.1